jgi:hypothetical protein
MYAQRLRSKQITAVKLERAQRAKMLKDDAQSSSDRDAKRDIAALIASICLFSSIFGDMTLPPESSPQGHSGIAQNLPQDQGEALVYPVGRR